MDKNNKCKRKAPQSMSEEVEKRLFAELSSMISTYRFKEPTISDITSKTSIYRQFIYDHFGNANDVLNEYIKRSDEWTEMLSPKNFVGAEDGTIIHQLIHDQYERFSTSVDFQNIVRWEVSTTNSLLKKNASKREQNASFLINYFKRKYDKNTVIDGQCLFAILSAAIYYLILRADVSTFSGIDFNTDEGKRRMMNVIDRIIQKYFEQ